MKNLSLLFLLFVNVAYAKEIKTDSFTLTLPDNYTIETDKTSRLLAFGGNGAYDLPFLSVEFGKEQIPKSVIERLNRSIQQFDKSLKEESCSPSCRAFYVELSTTVNDVKVYRYHYIVESEKINFIISFGGKDSLESGRFFVKKIASQIINSGIE